MDTRPETKAAQKNSSSGQLPPCVVRFTSLPQAVQDSVREGVMGDDQEWGLLSHILGQRLMDAPPGTQLAVFRNLMGMSQSTVAEKAGIRQADVSAAEKDVERVRLGVFRRIANAMGLQVLVRLVAVKDSGGSEKEK